MTRIIIDGYNLLPVTECRDREDLLTKLSQYQKSKNHEITIVFDGTHGGTGGGTQEHWGGVEVIYTPLTVIADDAIEAMLPKFRGQEFVVISSDRKVQRAADKENASFISSQDFAERLQAPAETTEPEFELPPWMEGRTEETDAPKKPKKGASRKLSKKERKRRKQLGKL